MFMQAGRPDRRTEAAAAGSRIAGSAGWDTGAVGRGGGDAVAGGRKDFFVSHAGTDAAWAEWVAWQLIEAGYTVELDVWDWAAGQNFITKISDALDRCDRVAALWSSEYFTRSRYTTEEWSAASLKAPGAERGRLIPLRVEDVPAEAMPGILQPLLYQDLFGLGEDEARRSCWQRSAARPGPGSHRCSLAAGRQGRSAGRGSLLRGCRICFRRCGISPFATRDSPAATSFLGQCAIGCGPGRRQWSKRCRGWVASARPRWPSNTHTGLPGPMTWPGGWWRSSLP